MNKIRDLRQLSSDLYSFTNVSNFQKFGGFPTVFSQEQEREIMKHILDMESRFFGLTTRDVRYIAYQLAERNGIAHPFNRKFNIPKVTQKQMRSPTRRKRGSSEILTCSSYKKQLVTKSHDTATKKNKRRKKILSEDDAECLYCNEKYRYSRAGESWITCEKCRNWCHELCAAVDHTITHFKCDLCNL